MSDQPQSAHFIEKLSSLLVSDDMVVNVVGGLVLAALLGAVAWFWRKSTHKPPVITGEIYDDTMPVTDNGRLLGRETTLEQLDAAWSERETRVLALVAWGGVGKTSVINYWLETLKRDPERAPERIYCWSFANQGTGITETSSSAFFTHALQWFEAEKDRFSSEHEKGQYLAKRINQQRTLLVLDGLEVFQHLESELQGKLRDPALFALLQALGRDNAGLCVVATRENLEASLQQIHGIKNLPLNNLSEAAGLALLGSFKLKGSDEQLLQVVRDYDGHAHSLSMLANFLRQYRKGDIQRKDTLPDLQAWMGAREANRIFAAYENELIRTPDLALLYLVSVFEKAVEPAVFDALLWALDQRQLRSFNAWLKPLLKARTRQTVLRRLQQSGLVSGEGDMLDLHPLARAYFRDSFQQHFPQTYRTAHLELYQYYKALPEKLYGKEQPDTLEEMQPLFHAVAHGCAAGLHQQVLVEVYWPRIKRENEHYLTKKLGAFSDDLAVVAHFFSQPWRIPAAGLGEAEQAGVLNWAGFRLRALGRLREAVEPMEAATDRVAKQENWIDAAKGASNLSELQLTLGQVAAALDSGKRSVGYADQSGDMFRKLYERTTHADALHQSGQVAAALAGFAAVEQLQREHQPAYPRLYSVQGFRYCDLLLAQGKAGEVLERAEEMLAGDEQDSLLDIALYTVSLGRAHHAQGDLSQARDWLDQAVAGLRKAGEQQRLPLGLLARAALWRDLKEWDKAQRDLAEVWDIAEPSGMRLHLTDYHLERARLLLAQDPHPNPSPSGRGAKDGTDVPPLHVGERGLGGEGLQYHIEAAAQLINATGYHRRDAELAELQQQLKILRH